MLALAASLIDWSALWKIVLAALIGGAGVVIVFAFLLMAVDRATRASSNSVRVATYALSGICSVFIVGAVVIGIYAMTQKPKSKPVRPAKAAALVVLRRTG
ncbi:MAG TPA: hypothetical protein VGI87_06305 [Solirubrobacteraceae bacterium]|jgi:hypothetical protein